MSHFAQLDQTLTVINVIVADQAFIDSGAVGDPASWLLTSYDGSIRKRFAGIGFAYSPEHDAFVPPRPFASWALDEATLDWVAPMPMPGEADWVWNEASEEWEFRGDHG